MYHSYMKRKPGSVHHMIMDEKHGFQLNGGYPVNLHLVARKQACMSAQFVAIGDFVMNPVTWYFNWVCDGATITLVIVLSSRDSSQRIV